MSNFFFFIFINLYLGLVEVGERTYINGPPNPPLNLPAHLCSITYITMYCKTRKMEKLLIRSRRTFMMGWLQWGDGKPKTTIPKEIALLSKMWQEDEPLIYPRHRVFFNSTKKGNRLIYCKNHTKQGTEDIQTFTRTQPKTLTALTHTTFHTNHTQLSNQTKNVHMVIWSK